MGRCQQWPHSGRAAPALHGGDVSSRLRLGDAVPGAPSTGHCPLSANLTVPRDCNDRFRRFLEVRPNYVAPVRTSMECRFPTCSFTRIVFVPTPVESHSSADFQIRIVQQLQRLLQCCCVRHIPSECALSPSSARGFDRLNHSAESRSAAFAPRQPATAIAQLRIDRLDQTARMPTTAPRIPSRRGLAGHSTLLRMGSPCFGVRWQLSQGSPSITGIQSKLAIGAPKA